MKASTKTSVAERGLLAEGFMLPLVQCRGLNKDF